MPSPLHVVARGFQINEHDMIVSLPSSLTGVVRRKEVSDYFYLKAAASGGHKQANRGGGGGRGRYFEDASADDKPLKELFREGQVTSILAHGFLGSFLYLLSCWRWPHAFGKSVDCVPSVLTHLNLRQTLLLTTNRVTSFSETACVYLFIVHTTAYTVSRYSIRTSALCCGVVM